MAIYGECQFIDADYGEKCPIHYAFEGLTPTDQSSEVDEKNQFNILYKCQESADWQEYEPTENDI